MKNKTKALTILSSLLLVTTSLVGCAEKNSAGDIDMIVKKQKLVVGTNSEYPPFEFLTSSSELKGLDISIAKLIGEEISKVYDTDITVEFSDMPFDGLEGALQAGKIDFIAAAFSKTPGREEVALFSDIYYQAKTVLLVKNDTDFETMEDLANKKLGAQLSTIQENFAIDATGDENLVKALSSISTLILELSTNNIDAIVIEKPVAESIISSNSNLKIIDTIAFADDDGYGYAALKTSTKLIEIINNVIEDLKSTGKIDQLLIEASEATGE